MNIKEAIHNEEVIALRIDNDIYFGQLAIDTALIENRCDQYYTRGFFWMLYHCDLGPKWKEYAENAPTLFLQSELERQK